jgi:dihydroorotate dehydrogenase electron transfer subunit
MGLREYTVASNVRRGLYATLTVRGDVMPSEPGQFYMVRGDWGADPLLGRPLSILGDEPESGTLRFLLKVFGRGSRRLYGLEPGEKLFALGPLGRPFPRDPVANNRPGLLVGGGVGVPPLVYLAQIFVKEGRPFRFLQGARTAQDLLCLEELSALGVGPELATEDGSCGERGPVTAPLQRHLEASSPVVYACGPEGMLKAVAGLCRGRARCYLSLEARMGCGYGVCLGCVIPVKRGGAMVYERVCQEGPVFEGEAVLWP